MMFVICLSWVVGRIKFVIIIFYIVGIGVDIDWWFNGVILRIFFWGYFYIDVFKIVGY